MDDLVNKTLGQFQITRELGRGGMAVVYEAYQPALQRKVALKVLPPSLAQDDFVRRFQHEAIAAAGLRHPNIVTIYDVGSEDRYNYIVMEFLEGRPLSDVIRTGGSLPLARICKIIEQVAQALDYAHQHGFIHRDIKPSNVMLDQADHATLTDFGIARALTGTHLTQTGTLIGTPEYMSPEQVTGEEIDARTDVYSLGIVAYEMVTGQVPFSGTTASVLYKQANTPPPPLRTHVPGVNPTVENVILRALAKRRDERYATAGQFAQALIAATASQPVCYAVTANAADYHATSSVHFASTGVCPTTDVHAASGVLTASTHIHSAVRCTPHRRLAAWTVVGVSWRRGSRGSVRGDCRHRMDRQSRPSRNTTHRNAQADNASQSDLTARADASPHDRRWWPASHAPTAHADANDRASRAWRLPAGQRAHGKSCWPT